jgi:hypothetical protein
VKIVTCHSAGRAETGIVRLLDGERRLLTIMAPWGQPLEETFRRIRDQLTDAEAAEVWQAFGLGTPNGAA